MSALLSVNGYSLDYRTHRGTLRVLDNVTLEIAPGEVLGLVGESGSGKSTLAYAIMRDLPRNAREISGEISFAGEDLRRLDAPSLAATRMRSRAARSSASSSRPPSPANRSSSSSMSRRRRST